MSDLKQWRDDLFLAFLAGLFDAEGALVLHRKEKHYDPELSVTNADRELLDSLSVRLNRLGISVHPYWRWQEESRDGISGRSFIGQLRIWKFSEVVAFLDLVPFRHREKLAKAQLARMIASRGNASARADILVEWKHLVAAIRAERDEFVKSAAIRLASRNGRVQAVRGK